MSTFEKVKRNILRDMDRSMTHTAESWANILLQNTSRLTNVDEQKKFWSWLVQPEGDNEHIVDPVCDQFSEHCRISEVDRYNVEMVTPNGNPDDEKSPTETVEMQNEYFRNGLGMYIKTKPVNTNSSMSELSQVDQEMKCEEPDE